MKISVIKNKKKITVALVTFTGMSVACIAFELSNILMKKLLGGLCF